MGIFEHKNSNFHFFFSSPLVYEFLNIKTIPFKNPPTCQLANRTKKVNLKQKSNTIRPNKKTHTSIKPKQTQNRNQFKESQEPKIQQNFKQSKKEKEEEENPIPEFSWFFFAIALTAKDEEEEVEILRLLKTLISKTLPLQSAPLQELGFPKFQELGFSENEFLRKTGARVVFFTWCTAHRSIPLLPPPLPPKDFVFPENQIPILSQSLCVISFFPFLFLFHCSTLETMRK